MASGGKRGAGERVLESKHVIGLFLLMLVFSGVFFTLGYVMGRQQYDGQVRASTVGRSAFDAVIPKPAPAGKHVDKNQPAATPDQNSPAPNPDWEFYKSGDPKVTDQRLKPPESVASRKAVPAVAKTDDSAKPVAVLSKTPVAAAKSAGAVSFTLQVAALTKESDALDLASRLQKQKFPAVVVTPQGDKFYRVQVGPYADQKSADAAKKGLETAGFKAFVKH